MVRISTRLRAGVATDLGGCGDAVQIGHAHIHENDIRPVGSGQVNRFAPGGCLGNDLEVGPCRAPLNPARPVLVVGDQYPHGHNALMPGLLVCVRGPGIPNLSGRTPRHRHVTR